jgi:plasmid stabilization system protein ParE
MEFNVRFSTSATHDIDDIAKNITQLWSEKVKTNFLVAISEKLMILEKNPFIYRKSISKPNLRECVVNKHVIMYYAVDEDNREVIILSLKNTKQSFK